MIHSQEYTERFLKSLSVNGASPQTIKAYRSDLKQFTLWSGEIPDLGNYEAVAAQYLTHFRTTWAPRTTLRKMASLRAYGKFLGKPDFLINYRGPTAGPGIAHPLPGGSADVLAMYAVAKTSPHKALVILNGLLGLRVHEVLACDLSWFKEVNGDLWLHVRGKGDKERDVPISHSITELLEPALNEAIHRDDRRLVPLTDRAARRAYTRLGRRAGISRPVATHDGRMTAGTSFYEASGGDIRTTQELLGHSNVETTQGYTHVSADKKRAAANVI
jgi:site-specific recombinase XerD